MRVSELVNGSRVLLTEEGIRLDLGKELFRPEVWQQVREWMRGQRDQGWLRSPFKVMTAEGKEEGSPRWKEVSVDALSWLVFVLLVPLGHPLVKLWQQVDWGQINELCQGGYKNGQRGQRAWAPAQMMALLLLLFMVPVTSEVGLLQVVAISPLYRWFCGNSFGLLSRLPDHSSLYTFRQRIGAERFEAILSWVVGRSIEAGLIGNELVFFDMMGVSASAHSWSAHERAVLLTYALVRYLELVEQEQRPEGALAEALGYLAAEIAIEVLENKRLKADPKAPGRVLRSLERWRQVRQEAPGEAPWELSLQEVVQSLVAADDVEVALAAATG